jgi:hypothetical protein
MPLTEIGSAAIKELTRQVRANINADRERARGITTEGLEVAMGGRGKMFSLFGKCA